MDAAEIGWRLKTHGRAAIDRVKTGLITPAWKRDELMAALAPLPGLAPARAALARGDWHAAHRELSRHLAHAPQRFIAGQTTKGPLVDSILARFPDSAGHAAARADRILAGEYDLLGYRGLRFDSGVDSKNPSRPSAGHAIDWHFDPVHRCRAPRTAWSAVPYLDPSSGDHKIIWELNRHQHWLTLGRAFWLTGDPKYRDRCLEELEGWIDANPPLVGINWASMLEIAFRSLSWLWALAFFADHPDTAARDGRVTDPTPWTLDLLLALDRQLTHVEHHLSHYFSPNTHLLGEALALYVSGLALPELSASPRRAETGRRILLAEIDRQIAADGGHCERSTHYHRYALDFYLLALTIGRLNGDPAAVAIERAVSRLASAARLLADDHGCVPHIGDDDGGMLMPMTGRSPDDLRSSLAVASVLLDRPDLRIGRIPEDALWLLGYAPPAATDGSLLTSSRTYPASAALEQTGYYVSRTAASDHLVIDGGPHGYRNGGHAHADALSLTLSVRGTPLLIDPGTACYTTDPLLRDRFRSTAFHNTLTVDGRPQSVANGPFHWSRTANSHVRRWRTNDGFDYFDGAHDGYQPLTHRRSVLALHGDLLIVADLVDGRGAHTAAAHWHIDPRWTTAADGRRATFAYRGERVSLILAEGTIERFSTDAGTGLGWHSPVYGRVEPATALRITRRATTPFWIASVFALRQENPVVEVDWLSVRRETGALAHSAGLRISRAASTDYLLIAEPNAVPSADGTGRGTWRIGDLETDARMLFYRATTGNQVSRLAVVDGSFVREAAAGGVELDLQRLVPDYFTDLGTRNQGRTTHQEPGTQDQSCAALPVS
jgi:hypothetical protein